MDSQALRIANSQDWARLDDLSSRRSWNGPEIDEMIRLYQATSTQLSTVQVANPDPVLRAELSSRVSQARAVLIGSRLSPASEVRTFFLIRLPAALYRIRWWIAGFTALFLAIYGVTVWQVVSNPAILDAQISQEDQLEYVNNAFASYYDPGVEFSAMVWTNNAWIALICVSLGISGIMPMFVIIQNALNVGLAGAMMTIHGEAALFYKLILPHGFLELTSIFVAAAAGAKLFWTLIDPKGRPRSVALSQEGRALFTVGIGLVAVLGVSGLVEGFVTGSNLLWWVKLVIGGVVWLAFLAYAFWYGKRVYRNGHLGDLEVELVGAAKPYAA